MQIRDSGGGEGWLWDVLYFRASRKIVFIYVLFYMKYIS